MVDALSFLLEIVVPVVTVLIVLSRISGSRQNEERYFALIGLLASKGVLNMDDLTTLNIFSPRDDVLVSMLDLLRGG